MGNGKELSPETRLGKNRVSTLDGDVARNPVGEKPGFAS